jgi:HAE1 family hydrophobic/amphiphilic exporter-1
MRGQRRKSSKTRSVNRSKISSPASDGIRTIYSTSRKGRSSITIRVSAGLEHARGACPDIPDAVARARNQLPDEIDEPVVTRDNGEGEVAIWLNFASQQWIASPCPSYANRHLLKSLSLVNGVSSVNLAGDLQRSCMCGWIRADEWAGYRGQRCADALAREMSSCRGVDPQ